jgi:hypothetical protein
MHPISHHRLKLSSVILTLGWDTVGCMSTAKCTLLDVAFEGAFRYRSCTLRVLLTVVMTLGGVAQAWSVERADIDKAYAAQLTTFAQKCDELKLPDEAALARSWAVQRLPGRQTVFVPPAKGPAAPKDELRLKAHEKFLQLRAAQAEKLFTLSQQYLDADDPTRAYQALHETLRENPDHAAARAILGFRLADGVWRVPGAKTGALKASVGHGQLKDFRPGKYWRVTTAHFQIATNAGPEAGQKFGEQLERLQTVWRQIFFRYWSDADELRARFAKPSVEPKPKKPFDVVLFKTREEYVANLVAAEPRIALTHGFYSDAKSTAFFYLGDARTEAICNHEVTHQLFQESGTARGVGAKNNFWIVEGIALYVESLRTFEHGGAIDCVTLGGWDADRLQFARHHVFNGQFQMPLAQLTAYSREAVQKDADIKRLYSQAAGVAHYLMDGDSGQQREATVTYLAGVYAGRADAAALAQLTDTPFEKLDAAYRDYLQVTDDDLRALPAPRDIRNLCLGNQAITDEGLAAVSRCENLEWLDLANVPVTDKGLAALAALKKLDQLNLEGTSITDATLAWLGKQAQLRELDLSRTAITDAGLAKLAALRNLEVLWLTNTPITDASAVTLARFKKLTTLDLDGTKLSASMIKQLRASLPSLNPEP